MTNSTFNMTTEDTTTRDWTNYVRIFEILTIITLCIAVWLLFSVILYGCKARRFRKRRSSSSLSSGPIYVAFTIVLFLIVGRITATLVAHILPRVPNWKAWCEVVYHVDNSAYIVSMYASYMFLWFLQRLVYAHPYVRKHIGKHMNRLSWLFSGCFTLLAIGMICAFIINNPVTSNKNGCVLAGTSSSRISQGISRNIISAVILLVAQAAIVYLCIYPVVKVKFNAENDDGLQDNKTIKKRNYKRRTVTGFISSSIRGRQMQFASPIEMTVKKAMISSMVMVITDMTGLLFSFLAFPTTAPVVLRQTIYDMSTLINAFCMLATFGFSIQVVTLCCPSRKKTIEPGRDRSSHVMEYPSSLDNNIDSK